MQAWIFQSHIFLIPILLIPYVSSPLFFRSHFDISLICLHMHPARPFWTAQKYDQTVQYLRHFLSDKLSFVTQGSRGSRPQRAVATPAHPAQLLVSHRQSSVGCAALLLDPVQPGTHWRGWTRCGRNSIPWPSTPIRRIPASIHTRPQRASARRERK